MTEASTLATLVDRRILVAEDEYIIAEEIATVLAEAGAEALGPMANVADALHFVAAEEGIEGALLDVNLHGGAIWPVVDALLARGVPVVLVTGYDAGALPGAYAHLPRCEKPISGRALIRTLAHVLAARRPARG